MSGLVARDNSGIIREKFRMGRDYSQYSVPLGKFLNSLEVQEISCPVLKSGKSRGFSRVLLIREFQFHFWDWDRTASGPVLNGGNKTGRSWMLRTGNFPLFSGKKIRNPKMWPGMQTSSLNLGNLIIILHSSPLYQLYPLAWFIVELHVGSVVEQCIQIPKIILRHIERVP